MASGGRSPSASARQRLGLLVGYCLLLAACASAYGRMRSEADIPECRRWIDGADRAVPVVRLLPAGKCGGEPVRVAVEARGRGDAARVDVLIHGVLSDARTWRYVAGDLARDRDVLLVDLPGCGRSDKPDPSEVGDDAYAPTALARNVLAALRGALEARPDRPNLTLVGHSLGTAIVLRMLGDPALRRDFPDVIERVDRAVLVAPVAFAFEKRDPLFERIAGLSGSEVTMAEVTGILRGTVADSVWNGVDDPTKVPREEADRLFQVLSAVATRRPAQAMLRSAIPFHEDGRCDWRRIERLEDDYSNVTVPCLLVCGGRDETVPQAMAFRLRQMLPRAWLRVVPKAMHTLPTERPEECVSFVRGFDASGGKDWTAFEDGRIRAPVTEPTTAARP